MWVLGVSAKVLLIFGLLSPPAWAYGNWFYSACMHTLTTSYYDTYTYYIYYYNYNNYTISLAIIILELFMIIIL